MSLWTATKKPAATRSAIFDRHPAQPGSAQTVLFEGAPVMAGDGSPAIKNAAILVDRGFTVQVGPSGEIAAPVGATTIALGGKTIMPTIISTHLHPGFRRGLTYSAVNFTRETILHDLNRELYFGVSTICQSSTT